MKLADCRNEIIISLLRKFSKGIVYALRIQSGRRYLSSSVHREETSNIMGAVSPQPAKSLSGILQMLYAKLEEKYMRTFTPVWLDSSIMQQLAALITSLEAYDDQ